MCILSDGDLFCCVGLRFFRLRLLLRLFFSSLLFIKYLNVNNNAIIAKVMKLQNQESTDLPIYEKQLKETEVGITNMLNAIQMGILTSSTKERLEALEEQRKELQARIAEERLAKPKMKEEFVRFNRKGRFGILF